MRVNKPGFTIIEIVIVMLIATIIILVIFLAVPSLSRSKANTQRTSEASLIVASVGECLKDRNFVTAACNITNLVGIDKYIDITSFKRLTILSVESPGAVVPDTQTAYIIYDRACAQTADDIDPAFRPRSFALLWKNEVKNDSEGISRCLTGS